MSNNNNKLRKEVVLPPSGSGAATGTAAVGTSDKATLKARLSELKTQIKGLTSEAKVVEKQLSKQKTAATSKKKTIAKKGKK